MKRLRVWICCGLTAAVAVLMLGVTADPASAIGGCPLTESTAPVANFTFSPGTPDPGAQVTFDASSSSPGQRTTWTYDSDIDACFPNFTSYPITSYSWDFGDGGTGTGVSPTHTYSSPGSYTATLTVSAGITGSDSTSETVKTSFVVTLTQPAEPGWWTEGLKRGTISLAATAVGGEPIARMEFYVRGTKVGEDTSAPYSIPFDTTSVSDGAAGFYARAVGTGGIASDSPTRNLKIDNTPPAFTLLEAPSVARPGTASFHVRFTDAEKLYGNAHCWADSVTQPMNSDFCIGAGVADEFDGWYTASSVTTDGEHTIYFIAADAAGNLRTGTANVRIDGTPPETTITSAIGSPFVFESSESPSTFRCRVYPDGTPAPEFGACSGDGTHAVSGLAPGTYRFDVAAADEAGNEDASPATQTFIVAAPDSGGGGGDGGGDTQPGGQTGAPVTQQSGTPVTSGQGSVASGPVAPASKPGKCAKLKGKKRARCIKKHCAKAKKKGKKPYKKCVKAVTRKR